MVGFITSRWVYWPTLRSQVRGTCWDLVIKPRYAGLIIGVTLVKEMRSIFNDERYARMDWHIHLQDAALVALQTYWVFTRARARDLGPGHGFVGKPEVNSDSSRGLHHLFPPGLGWERQMQEAMSLSLRPCPPQTFTTRILFFAMHVAGVWGLSLTNWRAQLMAALGRLRGGSDSGQLLLSRYQKRHFLSCSDGRT